MRQLVIIHGWSDTHGSFQRLGNWLVDNGIASQIRHVRLGDYVSMDDAVTFDDISRSVTAMPDIRKTKTVGYSTFGFEDIGSIRLGPDWRGSTHDER